MTFKQEVTAIAKEVASEYEDWEFLAGVFKNKTLKHTVKIISPGFTYSAGPSVNLTPTYRIYNKSIDKMLKKYDFNYGEEWCWHYWFIEPGKPDNWSVDQRFYPNNEKYMSKAGKPISELKDFLRYLMDDGIVHLEEKFDFSSEEAVWRSIPDTKEVQGVQASVTISATKALLGEFDYIERLYRGDIIQNDRFKRYDPDRIKKIIDDIPNLKKMWEEHGKIIL